MKLSRVSYTDNGTFGVLSIRESANDDYTPKFVTLENPWRANEPFISCIPTGRYTCRAIDSPKFGQSFEVADIPGRTHVIFHAGNTHLDTQGCILLGMRYGEVNNLPGIADSRTALRRFLDTTENMPQFTLDIVDAEDERF